MASVRPSINSLYSDPRSNKLRNEHIYTYPTLPKPARRIPSDIYTQGHAEAYQIQSPGFATPRFAAPPKEQSTQPLPTSTFIPHVDYKQAGFAKGPLSPLKQGYLTQEKVQVVVSPTRQTFVPPPVQDIHIFNSPSGEKTLYDANKRMVEQQQNMNMQQQPPQQQQPEEYQMSSMQQGQQMQFDPPPTQPIEQPPQQQQDMAYDQGYALNSNGQPHAPGQISHPNQLLGPQEYKNGLCSCFGDIGNCCLGCWCPCMLYSKTHHRLKTLPNSNLEQYGNCNGHCMLWCIFPPVSWVFTMIQRTRIREMYQIKGSAAGDCGKAYCCPCCVLVQDEREIRDREEEKRRCAGPGSGVVGESGYKKPEKMAYQRSSVIG